MIGSEVTRRLRTLWHDEAGAILSTELILVAVIAVVGLIVGLASIRDAMISELADVSGSVQELNQSYSYTGVSYVRDDDGNITIQFDLPPTDEGDFVPTDAPDPITHSVGDDSALNITSTSNGNGGSATGTIGSGSTTAFNSTTDTGRILGSNGSNIAFRESPNADGTYTTTFDDPIADLEFFVAGLFGGPDQNVVGNFTVTLSDGTVLNNAAFSIINDAITPNGAVGAFSAAGTDTQLVEAVTIGGNTYLRDPTTLDGTSNQGAGRIVFTDVPPPGADCIGIVSVSFERQGGPPNFTAYYSFSGSVIEIQP